MLQNQTAALCDSCRSPDVVKTCALCPKVLCETCVMQSPAHGFRMRPDIPSELLHSVYCRFCFDEKIEPESTKYEATLEKAKQVYIFFKTQRKEIPLVRKSKEIKRVSGCADRDETILRLAFMAAEKDFNALIETEVTAEKKRHHAHHNHSWNGTGIPAIINEETLDRQFKQNQIYR